MERLLGSKSHKTLSEELGYELKKSVKNDTISFTDLGNCWKMVQKLDLSFKGVKGWFPDFHSFYSFYHKYMKINIQRFGSSEIFDTFCIWLLVL